RLADAWVWYYPRCSFHASRSPRRCCSTSRSIPLSSRLLRALAGDLYQGPQRGIHCLGVGKELRNIGRKHDDVRAPGVSLGVLAPHALAEVVLGQHVPLALRFSCLLHDPSANSAQLRSVVDSAVRSSRPISAMAALPWSKNGYRRM